MPSISPLKESFAFGYQSLAARQEVVSHHTVVGTEDWYYYRGLLLLQQLFLELEKTGNESTRQVEKRDPSDAEKSLMTDMTRLLDNYQANFVSQGGMESRERYTTLRTRYHLLVYPINTSQSIHFIKDQLRLNLELQQPSANNDATPVDGRQRKVYPNVLDPSIIDPHQVVLKCLRDPSNQQENATMGIELMALPILAAIIKEESLTAAQEQSMLRKLLLYPQTSEESEEQTISIPERLARLWKDTDITQSVSDIPIYNLTIAQMDQLRQLLPEVIHAQRFVTNYMEKLVPPSYVAQQFDSNFKIQWDDDADILKGYLDRLWQFGNTLPDIYYQLKAGILFHKLRIDIARKQYEETLLINYLSYARTKHSTTGKSYSTQNSQPRVQVLDDLEIPFLGECVIFPENETVVIKQYLTGLICSGNISSLETLGGYLDYEGFLKPLHATVMLTHQRQNEDSKSVASWSHVLGNTEFEKLVTKSELEFTFSTARNQKIRLPEDPIKLDLTLKNISHLSIRVFQIDMFNYWRLSVARNGDLGKKDNLDLDGLCPSWEKHLDYSSVPALHSFEETFVFGGEQGLAADVFKGRGSWVIDFIGGHNQCRAIVQKGHLSHIIQNTTAGHLIRIFNERNECMGEDGKLWYASNYYQPDKSGDILIPYRADDGTSGKILLMTNDGFCMPVEFYHQTESYTLQADFYVNPETIVPSKQAKVVVTPRLEIHGHYASLSLLENVSLTVETRNAMEIKSTFKSQDLTVSKCSPIEFDFTIPMSQLKFTLSAKVRGVSSPPSDIEVSQEIKYDSSAQNIARPYLRATEDGYILCILGKNGEPRKNHTVQLTLKHTMVAESIELKMQTDDHGVIHLGKLENVAWINTSEPTYKQWLINREQILLPPALCTVANAPFKIALSANDSNVCSLFQIGLRGMPISDFSGHISRKDNYIEVSGLPEGRYELYIATSTESVRTIDCRVIQEHGGLYTAETASEADSKYWSKWILGQEKYGEKTGLPISRPLCVRKVNVTENQVIAHLSNWSSSNTFALVTATAFVSSSDSSLYSKMMRNRSMKRPEELQAYIRTPSTFLAGRKLSEEYQYILNRERAEKWVGSTLCKPSALMHPLKHASTTTNTRHLAAENKFGPGAGDYTDGFCEKGSPMYCRMPLANFVSNEMEFGFLNHQCPVLAVRPDEDGCIVINRDVLGDGNFLQLAVFSGEQVIAREMALPYASLDLKTATVCHTAEGLDETKAYIRSKSVSMLNPSRDKEGKVNAAVLNLKNGQHEWEVVSSLEKLFQLFTTLSSDDISSALNEYEFLITWPSFSLEKKLELHEKMNCHELNLWLKQKDPEFFDNHVKPFIKSKIYKSFMDQYLSDEDLHTYAESLSLFQNLNAAEKVLLAKRLPEILPAVRASFLNDYQEASDLGADASFDAVLAGSKLASSAAGYAGYSSYSGLAPPAPFPGARRYRSTARKTNVRSAPVMGMMASSARMQSMVAESNITSHELDDEDDEDEEDEEDYDMENMEIDEIDETDEEGEEESLRERTKQIQVKVPYQFVKPTSEWVEKGYYFDTVDKSNLVNVNQFWIDYLESEKHANFLSGNFIHATKSFTEVMFAFALLDIPFQSEAQWKQESNMENGNVSISSYTPCIIFYRILQETNQPLPKNPVVLLGQGFFALDETSANPDEHEMVEPNDLQPFTLYGWNLAISNISPKTCVCEVTMQIPTGSIPTGQTAYCSSKTIKIQPYSTWREVAGTFYFPGCGNYTHLPVTLAKGETLLNHSQPLSIEVKEPSETSGSSSVSRMNWNVVARSATDDEVVAYISQQKSLDRLDLGLITWRMTNAQFARRIFDLIGQERRFYSQELWQYGVYHGFTDVIRQLLEHKDNVPRLLTNVGLTFESPLVSVHPAEYKTLEVFDYYPIINARAHQLGSSREVLNNQFYKQYNKFLEYLAQKTVANVTDLGLFAIYLVLQDRIGEANMVYQDILKLVPRDHAGMSPMQVQLDYLGAYLQTRVRTEEAQIGQTLNNLCSARDTAKKYRACGVLRWRKIFASLEDYIDEVEGSCSNTTESAGPKKRKIRAIQSEPLLEFDIKDNQLNISYANVKEIQVRYYKMNAEVMFSSNPFINATGYHTRPSSRGTESYSLVKPSYIEDYTLEEYSTDESEDDYEIIGVDRIRMQSKKIALPQDLTKANIMVEITGGGVRRHDMHLAHRLQVHVAESYGVIRVMNQENKRPVAGAYVKVYVRTKRGHGNRAEFWIDGYTSLNGVFDYIGVTEGNALVGDQEELKDIVEKKVEKFSILVVSAQDGAVIKEAFPPLY
ncbi:hypothetical protein DFQ28_001072 [Apophysomyces sp. BC1034]|nr:hypothetical protein DFQ30_001070 [Apophysomyces sp. BC1015]KAG0180647.1 hypothetical protein DFQ29_000257 [Apophysomyces sp. BC1021]KAG0191042.1 hypothetical protein DFQ28_001072 [Apophysomyces sp. BC1034]